MCVLGLPATNCGRSSEPRRNRPPEKRSRYGTEVPAVGGAAQRRRTSNDRKRPCDGGGSGEESLRHNISLEAFNRERLASQILPYEICFPSILHTLAAVQHKHKNMSTQPGGDGDSAPPQGSWLSLIIIAAALLLRWLFYGDGNIPTTFRRWIKLQVRQRARAGQGQGPYAA